MTETKRSKITRFCRRHYWLLLLLVIAAGVFLYTRIPAVQAIGGSNKQKWQLRKEMDTFMEAYKTTTFSYMAEAYGKFARFTVTDSLFPFMKTVRTFTMGLGYVLVVLFALVGVIRESQKGDISMDYWFRIFTVTVGAVIVIATINPIMDSLYMLGNSVIMQVEASITVDSARIVGEVTDENEEEVRDKMEKALSNIPGLNGDENGNNNLDMLLDDENQGNFAALQEACEMMEYLNLIVLIPMLLGMYLIIAAVFEVKIRQVFAPIAVATIASEGARSSGTRFLKKYVACFVKIAIYFFIAAIGADLTKYFFHALIAMPEEADAKSATYVINLAMMLLSNIIASMAMLQSGGLGDEIVGI